MLQHWWMRPKHGHKRNKFKKKLEGKTQLLVQRIVDGCGNKNVSKPFTRFRPTRDIRLPESASEFTRSNSIFVYD